MMKSMYITADAAIAMRHRKPSIAPKSMHTTKKMKKITAAAVGMTTKATPMNTNAAAGMTMATKATPTNTDAPAGMTTTTKGTPRARMRLRT